MTCECDMAGFCERHKVNKTNLLHRKCQEGGEFWQAWENSRGPGQDREHTPAIPRPKGVGSHLKRILKIDGYYAYTGCACDDRAKIMNSWGPAKCRDQREQIIAWLSEEAKKRDWVQKVASFMVGDVALRDELGRYVDAAIAAAELSLYGPSVCSRESIGDVKWTVVVTTAPREASTLNQCIDSIRNCGWDPVVFAEPGSMECNAQTIKNPTRLGLWNNFVASVRWALETDAEAILTVQDDSLFHPDSRELIEDVMWPSAQTGFVSLYTPLHYSWTERKRWQFRPVGVNRVSTQSLWGACALAWPRDVLEHVIEHPIAKSWLGAKPLSRRSSVYEERRKNPTMIANSDAAIGKVLNAMQREMYFVDPSPVLHIARFSTIDNHGSNNGKRNCGRCADFGKPLRDQVFPCENSNANSDIDRTVENSAHPNVH